MTVKDQLLQELDRVPESAIEEVLEFVLALQAKHSAQTQKSDVWKAYLASKKEREEVYRRLANS
jgi:predicted Ser/Thr protein kinase